MEPKKGLPGYAIIHREKGSGQLILQIRSEEMPYDTSVNMDVVWVLVGDVQNLLYEALRHISRNQGKAKTLPILTEPQVRERLQTPQLEESTG